MKNNWIYKVFLLTFLLSIIFSGLSNFVANNFNEIILLLIIFIVILIGIIFDMFGVAVLTCNEASLHAMASKKIKGAKEGILLVKNSANIASLFSDVIGDICGIVSGSLSAVFTVYLCGVVDFNSALLAILVTAVTSTFTVTGKAIMKTVAINNCDNITLTIGKVVSKFKFGK